MPRNPVPQLPGVVSRGEDDPVAAHSEIAFADWFQDPRNGNPAEAEMLDDFGGAAGAVGRAQQFRAHR